MVLEEKSEVYISAIENNRKKIYEHLQRAKPIVIEEESIADPFKSGCPQCNSNRERIAKDNDNGETYCKDCGFVIYSEMSSGPEWRSYNARERSERSRAGPPSNPLIHDKGLGTVIPKKNIDFYGRKIKPESAIELNRLRKWNVRSRVNGTVERSIIYNNNEIDLTCQGLDGRIPRATQETAVSIMTRVTKGTMVDGKRQSLIRGRSRKALSKAATLIASRKSGLALTLDDMAKADDSVSRKDLARAYRDLLNSGVNSAVQSHEPLIKHYVNSLWGDDPEKSSVIEMAALKILKGARSREREDGKMGPSLTAGRAPAGMAASMAYISGIMCGQRQTQKDIASVSNITEVTVRNRYKDILDNLMIEYSI
jgi:transcription initiation factor TFIIB